MIDKPALIAERDEVRKDIEATAHQLGWLRRREANLSVAIEAAERIMAKDIGP